MHCRNSMNMFSASVFKRYYFNISQTYDTIKARHLTGYSEMTEDA